MAKVARYKISQLAEILGITKTETARYIVVLGDKLNPTKPHAKLRLFSGRDLRKLAAHVEKVKRELKKAKK